MTNTTIVLFSIDKPTDHKTAPATNLAANLTRAVARYKQRHGYAPNVVTLNRADVPDGFKFNGLRVEVVEDIKLKRQFRLLREECKENLQLSLQS